MSLATTAHKLNSVLKKANFILSSLLVLLFFLVLSIHLSQEIRDLDLWLHIKTGEYIVTNKIIPLNDIYSFSKPNAPWVNHEWLFQVIAYSVAHYVGPNGLIVLQNAVFLFVFVLIFAMGYRQRNYLMLVTGLFILLLSSSYRFTIRPDMFSVLFLVLFSFIVQRKRRLLYVLPLLQIIWTNIHGFFFLGPFIIFVFALFERQARLWVIFFLSLFATILNPQFVSGALYPLVTVWNTINDRFVLSFINELNPPLTLKTALTLKDWIFLKALIIISVFSFRFNQKKFNRTFFVLWALFLLFALCAVRNIIYFAALATIIIFTNVNERLSCDNGPWPGIFSKSNRFYYIARTSLLLSFSFCMVANANMIIKGVYYDFDAARFKSSLWGVSQENFPTKAVDFLLSERFPKRMFNDFNCGSYLIGRAFPQRRVFIDGRTELYGNDFLREYKKGTSADKHAREAFIHKYQFDGFLLTMTMSNFDKDLVLFLLESSEWKLVFFDESAFIFLKDMPRHQNLIGKYSFDLASWVAPTPDCEAIADRIVYPKPYIKRARILKELRCFKAAISEAQEAVKINRRCAEAHELLAESFQAIGEYQGALTHYSIAVALSPRAIDWRNRYALLLYKAGDIARAKENMLILLKSAPREPGFYHAMALLYREEGKPKEALTMIEKAHRLRKRDDSIYLRLWADILFDLKDYSESRAKYYQVLKLEPDNPTIKTALEKIENFL